MGFVSEFMATDGVKNIARLSRKAHIFTLGYKYYVDFLFQSMSHLIKLGNLPSTMPQAEVMLRLLMDGKAVITDKTKDKSLRVFFATPSKVSDYYYTQYDSYTINSPTWSTEVITKDDREGVLIRLNELKQGMWHTIHHYAIQLAHTDVSYVNTLINGRNKGVAIATTNKEKEEIKNYYNQLCLGYTDSILDESFKGVEFANPSDSGKLDIVDLLECRKNLLYSFFECFGLKTAYSKRGNMTDNEVQADDNLLIHNIANILDVLEDDLARVNTKYGTNITVDLSFNNDILDSIIRKESITA